MQQAAQGIGHGPMLLEFKGAFGKCSQNRVWIWGGPMWTLRWTKLFFCDSRHILRHHINVLSKEKQHK